jgi:hypothetical protein
MSSLDSFYSSVIDSDQKKNWNFSNRPQIWPSRTKRKKKYSKIWNAKDQFLAKKILVFGKTICKNLFFRFLEMKMISKWQFSSYYGKRTRRVIHKITYERLKMVIWDGSAISNRSGTVFTKLYFLHNLLMSLISRSVWLWQAFPALCNVTL